MRLEPSISSKLVVCLSALQIWSTASPALSADYVEDSNQSPPQRAPFYLNAEKRQLQGETEEQGRNPNRLLRGQSAVMDMPPAAPKLQGNVEDRGSANLKLQNGIEDRGGFNLKAEDWALPVKTGRAPLKGEASIKVLSDFDVELIVDESMSMRRRDCPGGTSRWEWCGMQLRDLSSRLAPFVPHGFTLTTFNGTHHVYPNATPANVNELFDNPFFMPGTRLSQPLTDRIQNYFNNRRTGSKPLLIVVITDGVPAPKREPYMVAQTLIDASRIMKDSREVTVVFFQIGGTDGFGRAYLAELDNNLVNNGARFDFVKTVSFEQLQQKGLTGALVDTIKGAGRRTSLSNRAL